MKRKTAPDLIGESLTGYITTDQEHDSRLDRYSRAKKNQLPLVEYIQARPEILKEFPELENIFNCGNFLLFKYWKETNFHKLVAGFSCKKHLVCNPCALRRDSRQMQEYSLKCRQVHADFLELVPVLITRTVKNGSDLSERYTHLVKIHKTLMQHRRDSLKKNTTARGRSVNSVMQYVRGSVGTYEFGRGAGSGDWHPHIHEIAWLEPVFEYTPVEIPGWKHLKNGQWERITRTIQVPLVFKNRLSKEYLDISGDSYIVDVRRIDCFDGEDVFNEQMLVKALCEVFKYALKFSELSEEDHIHAYRTLKGRRLIFSYGCMRGVKVDDNLVDSGTEELERGDYAYKLYQFARERYELLAHLTAEEGDSLLRTADQSGRYVQLVNRERANNDCLDSVLLDNGLRITSADTDLFVRRHLGRSLNESDELPF